MNYSSKQPVLAQSEKQTAPLYNVRLNALKLLKRNPIWVFLGLEFLFFSLATPYFFATINLSNVLLQSAFIGFLSVGLTLVMINGNIDLTVGATAGLAACLAVGLQPFGLWTALIAALAAGTVLGTLNGLLVEKIGINSFIVTLAGMIGIRGLAFSYAGETSLSATYDSFIDFGSLSVGPISVIAILFLAIAAIIGFVLSQTPHGRNAYAVGGNREAAVNAGIRVSRHVVVNFIISGLLASVCGVLMSAQMGAATPTYAQDYELWAVTAVVLGGTRLNGGAGRISGTLGGALALATLRNGMNLLHVQAYYVLVVIGLALIVALLLDRQFSSN
jgi:ribose transport system permease protein